MMNLEIVRGPAPKAPRLGKQWAIEHDDARIPF